MTKQQKRKRIRRLEKRSQEARTTELHSATQRSAAGCDGGSGRRCEPTYGTSRRIRRAFAQLRLQQTAGPTVRRRRESKKLTRIADSPVSRPLVEATIRFQRLQVADISWNRRTGHQALSCQTTICVVIAPPVATCMRGNVKCTRTARTHCSAHACASEAVYYRVSHVARTCARRAQQAACGVVSRHGDVVACRRCTSIV